ncbi:MAG: pyruvate dehydrogenase (acetyl-transferring), homodimeric type, partial [Phycisphaerae bacterium]|nr:pyruvate dehydrogenase (acetyl-transferring), homodimeric type [Phycisphaerae bacterium]
IRRMYHEQESVFYYLTLYNENYAMPPMPDGVAESIVRGLYRLQSRDGKAGSPRAQLLGSGPILREVLRAQDMLAERYAIASDVWSVTSYKELRRDAMAAERWNRLHPTETPRSCHLWKAIEGVDGPFIAASDYMRLVSEQIAPWLPGGLVALGTDGFGRSETREALRRHFEVDAECVVVATLAALAKRGEAGVTREAVAEAIRDLGVDPDKVDPVVA